VLSGVESLLCIFVFFIKKRFGAALLPEVFKVLSLVRYST